MAFPLSYARGPDGIFPMIPREHIGTAFVPDGEELRLFRRGGDFSISLNRNELMTTRMSGSEEALATMTLDRLGRRSGRREALHLLIGGYGMGFTLRAALAVLDKYASVTVAELVPEIIEWARGPMAEVTSGCLDDPRVMLVMQDVAVMIEAAHEGYDAILLDVDNGPEGLTRQENDRLYSRRGLQAAWTALAPGGILAIWSAFRDPAFTRVLNEGGFEVEEVGVRARSNGKGAHHVIWFAQKR